MSAATMEPNPKLALTLRELSACQHLARTHITFSLTLACPLKCAHCIVDAGPGSSPPATASAQVPIQRADLSRLRPAPGDPEHDENRPDASRNDRNDRAK